MSKDKEIQDVPYKYYPKVYLFALKNYIKSFKYKSKFNLNKKINECLINYKNLIKNDIYRLLSITSKNLIDYNNIDNEVNNLIKFINDMTLWYEKKYNNGVINDIFDNEKVILDNNFFNMFSDKEDNYIENNNFIREPNYKKMYEQEHCSHFKINEKGYIYDSTGLMGYSNEYGIINNAGKYIEGIHIKDIKSVLEANGYSIENTHGNLAKLYQRYKYELNLRELVLNAVLYNIIKNGGTRFGPRRGLLFAKEYGLNIDIPVIYGVEGTYYNDYKFINIYLNNGGNKDLRIFVDYFGDGIERCFLEYTSIDEFLNNRYNNEIKKLNLKNTGK